MAGYVLKIVLENTHPPVWRRVLIPDKITFADLHQIIQVLFEWENIHLHSFQIPSDHIYIENCESSDLYENYYPEAETLIDPFMTSYKWIRYIYDFGDDWRHKIIVEKTEDYTERFASLLKFKGDNFIEDSGGIWDGLESRFPFERGKTEKLLQQLSFPINPSLKEPVLPKHSLNNFIENLKKLSALPPEQIVQALSEDTPSDMYQKIHCWNDFYAHHGETAFYLSPPSKKNEELLASLGDCEIFDYCKYLQLQPKPFDEKSYLISVFSETIRLHPEYILYVLNEEEFTVLTDFMKLPYGPVSCKPEYEFLIMKLLSLGLGDFNLENDLAVFRFAIDFADRIKALNDGFRKRIYRRLERFDARLGELIQVYCVIELDSLYEIYCSAYKQTIEKIQFLRTLYWHSRFCDFIDTSYSLDGKSYASQQEIDVQKVLEKEELYAHDLPYARYSAKELHHLAEDLANRSEYMDFLFTTFHYQMHLDIYESQKLLLEIAADIFSGDTLNELMKTLQNLVKGPFSPAVYTELWHMLSVLMQELELPMLKGRSRETYANEKNVSPWSIGMVESSESFQNTKHCHLYEFPVNIQELMEHAFCFGDKESIRQLTDYQRQNHIVSEEFQYLLKSASAISGEGSW